VVVTIIDTDVEGGSYVGIVAMIEVVALMIGDIVQCYSGKEYEKPAVLGMENGLSKKGYAQESVSPGQLLLVVFESSRKTG